MGIFLLEWKGATKQTALSFGFGSLASIIRNNRQFDVNIRRKGQALCNLHAQKIGGIRSVLSVALNDPSKKPSGCLSLAILHHEELGMRKAEVISKVVSRCAA